MGIQEHPDVDRVVDAARETITVGRVFGEAYEQGAPTVIPAAQVAGGGGGGGEPEDADGKVGRYRRWVRRPGPTRWCLRR